MAGLSCINPPLPLPLPSPSNTHRRQCRRSVRASNNKDRSNYIEIGSARKDPGDAVEIRLKRPIEPQTRSSSRGKAPPPAVVVLPRVDSPPEQQTLIVEATKRGRGGKTVTIVKGLQLRLESMEALCKQLKTKLGSGGSVKDGQVEIQGDHMQKLVDELGQLGYKAKKSGR